MVRILPFKRISARPAGRPQGDIPSFADPYACGADGLHEQGQPIPTQVPCCCNEFVIIVSGPVPGRVPEQPALDLEEAGVAALPRKPEQAVKGQRGRRSLWRESGALSSSPSFQPARFPLSQPSRPAMRRRNGRSTGIFRWWPEPVPPESNSGHRPAIPQGQFVILHVETPFAKYRVIVPSERLYAGKP